MPINLYSKDSVDDLLDAKLSDAPIDGSTYGRNNGAWAVVTGGGLTISTLSNAATSTLNAGVPTAGQALTYDGTDLVWATVGGGGAYLPLTGGTVTGPIIVDESATSGFTLTLSGALLSFDGTGCYISGEETSTWGLSVSNCPAINFSDSTSQTTAAVSFNGGTVYAPISVTGSGGTVSMGDSIGFDLSGSTAGAGVRFADSTVQYTAAVAPPSADVLTANAIASNVNYISGSSGTWVGLGLPSIAGLVSWGVYNPSDGYLAYSYSMGTTFYLSGSVTTSNNTVQVSGSNSSFIIA